MKRKYLVLLLTTPWLILSCHKDSHSSGLFSGKLTTAAVTAVTDTSAIAGGSFSGAEPAAIRQIGVQLDTDSTFSGSQVITLTAGTAAPFTISVPGLTPATLYYVKAYAYDEENRQYFGNTVTFTTSYQPGNYNVTTLAGRGTPGFANGLTGPAAFFNPQGAAVDAAGNVYIADGGNNAIRLITTYGTVSTFAITDGSPNDVVIDSQGNVYVAEANFKILKITPNGQVSTFAGSGSRGKADGIGTAASFNAASALSIDPAGNLYVGDLNAFRKITPAGVVTTLTNYFGTDESLTAIAVDSHYNLFETNATSIIKIDSLGNETPLAGGALQGHTDGTGAAASFGSILEMRTNAGGILFVTDAIANKVRMITPAGVVTTIAGSGAYGARDGNSAQATFQRPVGLTPDNAGNIIVCDQGNNTIRKVAPL